MSWTDERIDRLKAMWANGATASQIADELGGVSRNAVIGKAHRLGLEARPSPVKPGEEKESPKKAAKAAAPKTVKAPKSPPAMRRTVQALIFRHERRRPSARKRPTPRSSIVRSVPAALSARVP